MDDQAALQVRLHQRGPIPLNVELSCAEGELVALVGPSGSGKTTVLRSIAGLYRPQHGIVVSNGTAWLDTDQSTDVPPHLRRVGFVFQSYALFPHWTALGNVMAALGHRPASERKQRAREFLALVHLAGFEDRRPSALSGGEQQRVAVARALAREPAVLILDEPFSAVDRRTRRRLHDELASLRRAVRIPILLVTHDLDEAAALSDRICVLDQGETLQTATPAEVMAGPVSRRVAEALDLPSAAGNPA